MEIPRRTRCLTGWCVRSHVLAAMQARCQPYLHSSRCRKVCECCFTGATLYLIASPPAKLDSAAGHSSGSRKSPPMHFSRQTCLKGQTMPSPTAGRCDTQCPYCESCPASDEGGCKQGCEPQLAYRPDRDRGPHPFTHSSSGDGCVNGSALDPQA